MTPTVEEISSRIREGIVEVLELDIETDSFSGSTEIFSPMENGGLELDSLSALEIFVFICREWELEIDEIEPDTFRTPDTLAIYVHELLETGSKGA